MNILVVGLGNPILGDDGVGWAVAAEVKKYLIPDLSVDVVCLSLGGINLMEHLIGYDCAILVDAFLGEGEPGSIVVTPLDDIPDYSAFHVTSAHDMSLQNAMKLGRQLGAKLPDQVMVIGVLARHVYEFSEELSPPVEDAVPKAAKIVVEMLMQKITIH